MTVFKPGTIYLLKNDQYFLCVATRSSRHAPHVLKYVSCLVGVTGDDAKGLFPFIKIPGENGEEIVFGFGTGTYIVIDAESDVYSFEGAKIVTTLKYTDMVLIHAHINMKLYENRRYPERSFIGSIIKSTYDRNEGYAFLLDMQPQSFIDNYFYYNGFFISKGDEDCQPVMTVLKTINEFSPPCDFINHLSVEDYAELLYYSRCKIEPNMREYFDKYIRYRV